MTATQTLKSWWKKLGVNGEVRNFSSSKTPADVDADGIRRVDDKPINGHKSWWKLYDYTTMEVFDDGDGLKISANRKTPVTA